MEMLLDELEDRDISINQYISEEYNMDYDEMNDEAYDSAWPWELMQTSYGANFLDRSRNRVATMDRMARAIEEGERSFRSFLFPNATESNPNQRLISNNIDRDARNFTLQLNPFEPTSAELAILSRSVRDAGQAIKQPVTTIYREISWKLGLAI